MGILFFKDRAGEPSQNYNLDHVNYINGVFYLCLHFCRYYFHNLGFSFFLEKIFVY